MTLGSFVRRALAALAFCVPFLLLAPIAAAETTEAATAGPWVASPPAAAFVQAFKDYLAWYSPARHSARANARPDVAYALFGTLPAPYDIQGFDPEAAIAEVDVGVMGATEALGRPFECRPLFIPAAREVNGRPVAHRGSVLFIHGFSGCPQQFEEWARRVSRLGFDAFLPLLPGQGRGPAPVLADLASLISRDPSSYYGGFLPDGPGQSNRYDDFASYLNEMMAKLPAPRHVIATSVGSAVGHRAILAAPALYQRAIFTSPYYRVPGPYLGRRSPGEPSQGIGDSIYNFERWIFGISGELPLGWGPFCYDLTSKGRRGVCDFRLKHLQAVGAFADGVVAEIAKHADQTPQKPAASRSSDESTRVAMPQIQFVPVAFDPAADTIRLREVFQHVHRAAPGKTSICFMSGVPHAFFSRQDYPGEAMDWLPGFAAAADRFLVEGVPFATDGPSEEFEQPSPDAEPAFYPRCKVDGDQEGSVASAAPG